MMSCSHHESKHAGHGRTTFLLNRMHHALEDSTSGCQKAHSVWFPPAPAPDVQEQSCPELGPLPCPQHQHAHDAMEEDDGPLDGLSDKVPATWHRGCPHVSEGHYNPAWTPARGS